MARRVFFSFQYNPDVTRAYVVRNSWVAKPDTENAGFVDAADFEKVKQNGDSAIKKWIDDQLSGTSVTVVLLGSDTNNSDYVKYEIEQSYKRGNGLLGIYIHKIKDFYQNTGSKGSNTFGEIGKDVNKQPVYFSGYPCYDWVDDDGYTNIGKWVEAAAKKAGK